MSEFSEAVKEEIKNANHTLLYLSEVSGLSLDHISKMRQGKRLPQDEEKVRKLIEALECPEAVSQRLFSLYKIEKMGDGQWNCIQEIKQMLEFRSSFFEKEDTSKSDTQVHGHKHDLESFKHVKTLQSRMEIFVFLQEMLNAQGPRDQHLRLITKELPEFLVELLAADLYETGSICEHCFSLRKNSGPEGTLYNLKYMNRIMPCIRAGSRYIPYYDYEMEGDELLPNWIIEEQWAMGLDKGMESGIVLWDDEGGGIARLISIFNQKKSKKRKLLRWFEDPVKLTGHLAETYGCLHTGTRRCPSSGEEPDYYMGPSPCLLFLAPQEIIRDHMIADEEEMEEILEWIRCRGQQLPIENTVYFFTSKELELLAGHGKIPCIPDEKYRPFSMEERRILLEKYLEWVQSHKGRYFMIDTARFNLPLQTSVYSTSAVTDNEFSLCFSMKDKLYFSVTERGAAVKLSQFCKLMEAGEFVYTHEKSVECIQNILKQLHKNR